MWSEAPHLTFESNVTAERIVTNVGLAVKREGARWLEAKDAHGGVALIVGGGASLKGDLGTVWTHQQKGAKLFALNNVPKYLISKGIAPDAHVLLDAIPEVADFVENWYTTERYYASQCHPSVHDRAGDELILWHPAIQGLLEVIPDCDGPFVGGGTTIGTRAIGVAYMLGYRNLHLFGLDSSYEGDFCHAYEQGGYADLWDVKVGNEEFRSPPQLIAQAQEFQNLLPDLIAQGCEITVHGTGLLPSLAAEIARLGCAENQEDLHGSR